jgi:hypothetical protein
MMVYSLSLAPRQLQSLAGLEHGRSIPSADTARNRPDDFLVRIVIWSR